MIYSFSTFGYEGSLISVESDIRRGIPCIDIVGLADGQVKESRERIQSAIRNSSIDFPDERVLLSLSPTDLRKDGNSFDLALALSVITSNEKKELPNDTLVMGELELNGNIRQVRGIYAGVKTALSSGIKNFIIPGNNFNEVKEIQGIRILKADNLSEVYSKMYDQSNYIETVPDTEKEIKNDEEVVNGIVFNNKYYEESSYDLKRMNPRLLKALVIAISGHHHLIGYGKPGNGKTCTTHFAQFFTPSLSNEESQETTRIHSLSGLLSPTSPMVKNPPFRMPHQTATIEGICGGGPNCRPGEGSLSHNGILFLDEMAEFRSSVIQMLRVPMESKAITLSRAGRSTIYPSKFTLIGMANPCPCGNYGNEERICLCSAKSIEMYWRKFSSPLLDRCLLINTDYRSPRDEENYYTLSDLRKMVANATVIQRKSGKYNGDLTPNEIEEFKKLQSEKVLNVAEELCEVLESPRRISMLWKVAKTVANLDKRENLTVEDLNESYQLCKDFSLIKFSVTA